MAVTSGFFDSVNGDRTYDAEQMTNYFQGLVSDGVYQNVGEALVVKATGEGLNITVGSGRALVKTHWMKNDEPITLTLSPANTQYDRYDSIFIRYNATTREINIYVAEGIPAPHPQIVSPTQTETIYDLFLARIMVNKNTGVLSQSAIYDFRGSGPCPWITGLIKQVDTSELFLQFQTAYEEQYEEYEEKAAALDAKIAEFDAYMIQKRAEFDEWYASLTQELRVDTTIHQYQLVTEVGGITDEVNINSQDFDPEADILQVFVDGIFFAKGNLEDYTIAESGYSEAPYKIVFTTPLTHSATVTMLIIKSVIGEGSSLNAMPAFNIGNSAGEALLGVMEYLDPNIILADWEQGDITSSGNVDSTTKIRIPNYIDLPQGVTSVYFIGNNTANKTLQFAIETYDENDNFLEDLYWYGAGASISITNTNAAKFRSVIQFSDKSTITPTQVNNVGMFYATEEV